jgi:leucyl-tRNA synthetase
MELVNELYAFVNRAGDSPIGRPASWAVLEESIEALVLMLSPFAPHMCEELWEQLGHPNGVVAAGWPEFDEAVARADEIVVPVQVNGKVRARLTVAADISEDALKEAALADPQVVKYLEGKTVRKVVVAGGQGSRLVSVVVS